MARLFAPTFVFGEKLLPCFEITLHFAIVTQLEHKINVVLVFECTVELQEAYLGRLAAADGP
jgi:hypothetical protein